MTSTPSVLDPVVRRLRWVVAGNMIFNVGATLACQPESFWRHPETAIRGDGLSIANPTNYTFQFFLGRGWLPYLAASLVYVSLVFLLVSVLPRLAALVTMFSFLFGYAFSTANWIQVGWHLGYPGFSAYQAVLGMAVVTAAFSAPAVGDLARLRLRWTMVLATGVDFVNTLAGQPHSYWLNPMTAHEANPVSRYFLQHGWAAFVGYDVFYIAGLFWLATVLPKFGGLVFAFALTLGGFVGASCWYFYVWKLGMQAPVLFGCVLSTLIVAAVFAKAQSPAQEESGHLGSIRMRILRECCKTG